MVILALATASIMSVNTNHQFMLPPPPDWLDEGVLVSLVLLARGELFSIAIEKALVDMAKKILLLQDSLKRAAWASRMLCGKRIVADPELGSCLAMM